MLIFYYVFRHADTRFVIQTLNDLANWITDFIIPPEIESITDLEKTRVYVINDKRPQTDAEGVCLTTRELLQNAHNTQRLVTNLHYPQFCQSPHPVTPHPYL